jgi:hypothetical protein
MANRIPPRKSPSQRPDPEPDYPPGRLREAIARPEVREQIRDAGVIFGTDVHNPGNRSLFFGKANLERILKSGRARATRVTAVPVDFDTDDVEVLVAACITLKGSCCYNASDGEPGMIDPAFN